MKCKFILNNFSDSSGRKSSGFTLIELLVVIAIIGILFGIIMVSMSGARGQARDARRKADMSQIQKALEIYYTEHDSYPIAEIWSGVCPWFGGHSVSGPDAYIPGLSNILPTLPTDPSGCKEGDQGYIYTTFNTDGKSYKLLSYHNPESYPSPGEPFFDPNRPTWAWMLCSPDGFVCDETTFPH